MPLQEPGIPRVLVHRLRRHPEVLWVAAAALLVAVAAWAAWPAHERAPAGQEEVLLCWHFAALHNARDAGADKLLGPEIKAPQGEITPEEAVPIDADTFLRRDLMVLDVLPDPSAAAGHHFILVTKGAAAGQPLRIRSGDKVDRIQGVVTNPALVVEVRDGKIYGVRVQLPPG